MYTYRVYSMHIFMHACTEQHTARAFSRSEVRERGAPGALAGGISSRGTGLCKCLSRGAYNTMLCDTVLY